MSPVLVAGAIAGALLIPALYMLASIFRVEVEEGEAVLITRFGKLAATLDRPGWHWLLDRPMPWVDTIRVSLRSDYRDIRDIAVNDARGTTVIVDVWLEIRVADPAKATFEISDWSRALEDVVSHAVIAILGNREWKQILCDRSELGELLRKEIAPETERWGLKLEELFIRNVSLLPDVARQLFATVAARLDRAKADIEEEGRQRVSLLEARTDREIAALVVDAKAQYPAAVARAHGGSAERPHVWRAYEELHDLALLHPQRVVSFRGFEDGEIDVQTAAMLTGPAPKEHGGGNGEGRGGLKRMIGRKR